MTDDEAMSPAQEPSARVTQNSGETPSPAQVIAQPLHEWFDYDLPHDERMGLAGLIIAALGRAGYVIAPREALDEALEDMLDMRSYVPDYFAEQWEHDKAIARFTALIEAGATPRKDAET